MQEEYIKEEQRSLKRELLRAQEEVKRIQSVPLVIGQFLEMVDTNSGIVGSTTGSNYYVRILSTLNRELLKPSASIALHRHSNALVDILPPEADSSISLLTQSERPDVTYQVVLLHYSFVPSGVLSASLQHSATLWSLILGVTSHSLLGQHHLRIGIPLHLSLACPFVESHAE